MADWMERFNDFSGGDYGEVDPAYADKGTYRGTNVCVYNSGLLGPRAGTKQLTVTWPSSETHTVAPGPVGFGVFGENLLIVLDDLYQIPIDTGVAVANTAYASAASATVRFAQAASILYSLSGGVVYKHVGTGTASVSTPQPLSEIIHWNYWLVGVDSGTKYRIWFTQLDASGPAYDTWPANNYIDVGGNDPITALIPVYNTLYVGKKSGWYAVSGVLGTAARVREVVLGNGPKDLRLVTATGDNRIIYWPVEAVPTWFNGNTTRPIRNQLMRQDQTVFPCNAVVATPTGQRLLLAGDGTQGVNTDIAVHEEGRWAYHTFPQSIGGLTPQRIKRGYGMPDGVVFMVNNPTTIGDDVVISSWHHDLNRPAHSSDDWSAPVDVGDTELVTGSFTLPARYDGQGRQIRVKSLIVQFRKWPSGVTDSVNKMSVRVNPLGQYEAGNGTGTIQQWSEPSERAATGGTDDSWRISLGDQGWANGYQIEFTQIAGVALREVVAVVDARATKV